MGIADCQLKRLSRDTLFVLVTPQLIHTTSRSAKKFCCDAQSHVKFPPAY